MKSLTWVILCIYGLGLIGCGSIINGTRQDIGINTTPSRAIAKISTGENCVTPCVLNLKRNISHTITIEKKGYEPSSASLGHRASGWIAGNLFLGGPIGLLVDFATGGAYTLDPDIVNINLMRRDPNAPKDEDENPSIENEVKKIEPTKTDSTTKQEPIKDEPYQEKKLKR